MRRNLIRASMNVPVTCTLSRDSNGDLCVHVTSNIRGMTLAWGARVPKALAERLHQRAFHSYQRRYGGRRDVAAMAGFGGVELGFSLKKAWRGLRRAVVRNPITQAVKQTVKAVAPAAVQSVIRAVAAKTGKVLSPKTAFRIFKAAAKAAWNNKLARAAVQKVIQGAIAGNPIAMATLTGLRVAARFVPQLKVIDNAVQSVTGPGLPIPGLSMVPGLSSLPVPGLSSLPVPGLSSLPGPVAALAPRALGFT